MIDCEFLKNNFWFYFLSNFVALTNYRDETGTYSLCTMVVFYMLFIGFRLFWFIFYWISIVFEGIFL